MSDDEREGFRANIRRLNEIALQPTVAPVLIKLDEQVKDALAQARTDLRLLEIADDDVKSMLFMSLDQAYEEETERGESAR